MSTSLQRLVRKEVSLGAIRELPVPQQYIGLQIAPWLNVATDDVIFSYLRDGLQEGLAPARAEDVEAELAQKDDLLADEGRASLIDWSLKDKYTASDVSRYRDSLFILEQLQGTTADRSYNVIESPVAEFNRRIAKDDARRKRTLDNRIEWLVTRALETGVIAYNDGRIKFGVDFGRPADQQNVVPASGAWTKANAADMDPIGDLIAIIDEHFEKTGIRLDRGIISQKTVNQLWTASRFLAAVGMPVFGGTTTTVPVDPNYIGLSNYNPTAILALVEQVTGVQFTIYDGIYRTRALGGKTGVNNRYISEGKVILYPGAEQIGLIDDSDIGFAKTLTSPHPEGNWSPGFYEWEDESKDPWLHFRGSGVKAFPVFPHMDQTVVLAVN